MTDVYLNFAIDLIVKELGGTNPPFESRDEISDTILEFMDFHEINDDKDANVFCNSSGMLAEKFGLLNVPKI